MSTLLIFADLLLGTLLIEPLAKRLHLPFSAALVTAGFAGSEIVVAWASTRACVGITIQAPRLGLLLRYLPLAESGHNTS